MAKFIQLGLRLLANPFHQRKPLKFQCHLKDAKSVLIFFNKPVKEIGQMQEVHQLFDLLKGKKIRLIEYGISSQNKKTSTLPVTYLSLKKNTLWHIMRSTQLHWLASESYDIYLDLSQSSDLLSTYMSYKIQSPLKIVMGKSENTSFHLQYQPAPGENYPQQLHGFTEFIQKMGV